MSQAADHPVNQHEEDLATLVSSLLERLQAGEQVDYANVCEQYPHLAVDLKEVWGTLVVADVAATSQRLEWQPDWDTGPKTSGFQTLPKQIGDYELLEVIGRGGMGVVYRARQVSLNREVAVKMIQENRPLNPETRNRFLAEAKATARLDHPCIVPVYEVSEFEGQPFFSMQLIRGRTLADWLRPGKVSQRQAARIISEVSRAIGYAHSMGILHRDIKPSNIMLDELGRVRVTDFGLAKFADSKDSLTRTGAAVGTLSYMAPEQAAGLSAQIGPRSDVYALGAVLFHLLAGRPPLIADSPVQLAMQILEHDPPPLRLLDPKIDRDLELIVARSIQKPPNLRYRTADRLAADLEAYLKDEPVRARRRGILPVLARLFRDTHHAVVLENWGLLWMWHSLALLIVCLSTEWMHWSGVRSRISYAALWIVGLGTWALVFWALRHRQGPVTFVERQIAHVWVASLIAIALLTPMEWLLGLSPLTLSPMLPLIGAIMFFVKAGILAGQFYVQALLMLVASFAMAVFPQVAHIIFGVVAAGCFFVPGLKYFRLRQRSQIS